MVFVKKFNKKEILEIVALAAAETLPPEKKGVVEAFYVKGGKGSIEVQFLPYNKDTEAS